MRDVREKERKKAMKERVREKRGGGDPTGWVMCRCPPLLREVRQTTERENFVVGVWRIRAKDGRKGEDVPERAGPRGKRNAKKEEGRTLGARRMRGTRKKRRK